MKSWKPPLVAIVLSAGCSIGAAGGLQPGGILPMGDVKMENVDGRFVSIKDAAGEKGTLVIFSCNHCPFVKAWEKRIAAIGNESAGKGIGTILINANDPAEYSEDDLAHMKKQADAGGYQFPYVVDGTSAVAREFGAARTPEAFLFDAAGKLVYHGAIDDNAHNPDKVGKRYLQDAIDALAAGREIAMKETSSVGCSIKFRPIKEGGKP